MAVAAALVGTVLALRGGSAFTQEARYHLPKGVALALAALPAAWALARAARAQALARWPVFDAALGGYLVLRAAGALAADVSWRAAAAAISGELAALLVLLAARALAAARPAYRAALAAWVTGAATLVAAVALAEACGLHVPGADLRRPAATLGNRNVVAAYCAVVLPLAAWRAARGGAARLAPVAMLAAVVVLARCRSVWLGCLLAALVVAAAAGARAWRSRPLERRAARAWSGAFARSAAARRRTAAALALGALAGALVPWPGLRWGEDASVVATARRLTERSRGTGRSRLEQYRVAADIVAAHPWRGAGPGRWSDAALAHAHAAPGVHAREWVGQPTPQSDLARTAAESGLPAVACALVAAAALALWLARRAVARAPGPAPALLAAGAVALVHALLDAPLYRPETLALFAVVAAVAGVPSGRPARAPAPRVSPARLAPALALASLAGAVLPFWASLHAGRDATPQDLTRAVEIFPDPRTAARRASVMARDPAAALEAARAALAIAPHQWGAMLLAARSARALGRSGEAAEWVARARELEPHLDAVLRPPPPRAAELRAVAREELSVR